MRGIETSNERQKKKVFFPESGANLPPTVSDLFGAFPPHKRDRLIERTRDKLIERELERQKQRTPTEKQRGRK